jgi:hypothetical protein
MAMGDLAVVVGKYFLGPSYVSNTLEMKGRESLVINLREFDCFTFVENVVVLTRLLKKGRPTFSDYTTALRNIRYRRGILKGYSSRLHYFSDWLRDNKEKGILQNVTRQAGGRQFRKRLTYMTDHKGCYPALNGEKTYREMAAVERRLSRRLMYSVPKDRLVTSEGAVRNGDVIAMTTEIEGLDVVHVGPALWRGKRLHLLHASEGAKKVVISCESLQEYLAARRTMTGIMIARLRPAGRNGGNHTSE